MYTHDIDRNPSNNLKPVSTSASVCGQLDPPSQSNTSKGWRYLQCADSLNGLRVLIPPRPAAIYANLLKVEAYSFKKNDAEYLRYIHHLKEAMVKKCQKLARQTMSESQATQSASIVEAPLDFKLKRLEQWWEEMESRGRSSSKPDFSRQQRGHGERHGTKRAPKIADSSGKGHKNSSTTHALPSTPLKQTSLVRKQSNGRLPDLGHSAQAHYIVIPGSVSPAPPGMAGSDSLIGDSKRPPHLMTSGPSHLGSTQPSPSLSHPPQTPIRSPHHTSSQLTYPQSPHNLQPLHSPGQKIVYTNSQSASPLETPYNPYFDPNYSLASQSIKAHLDNGSPNAYGRRTPEQYSIAPASHSPTYAARAGRGSNSNIDYLDHSADIMGFHGSARADPSLLKSQFHATYLASPSKSNHSPPSVSSKPSSSPLHPEFRQYASRDYLQVGSGQINSPRSQEHKSFTVSYSANIASSSTAHSPPTADKEHRRRATMDNDDTDKSVSRPKGYMYRSSAYRSMQRNGGHSGRYSNDSPFENQGVRNSDSDHSPSGLRRIARVLHQTFTTNGSPLSSGSPSGSPHSQGSAGPRHAYRAHINIGSPNLLPPAPALHYHSPQGSNDGSNTSRVDLTGPGKPRNRLTKRRSRRTTYNPPELSPNINGAYPESVNPALQHAKPEQNAYTLEGRCSQRDYSFPSDVQHNDENDKTHSTSHRDGSSRGRSPRYVDRVIPDMAVMATTVSSRNSRYTSGESSVSEPVIPDVSLIMEAENGRNKSERVRRRLIPLRSSSEEGGAPYYESSSDLSGPMDYDSEDGEEQGGGAGNIYRRPYRTRDGYGSGYASEADGGQSRPLPRAPSRPPSRGILKRSSSQCSQRSNKSVRIEIPKERKALEEVREAEDRVDNAEKRLKEIKSQLGTRTGDTDANILEATEAVKEAKRKLEKTDAAYQIILKAMESKKADRDETETSPRYV